MLWRGGCLEAGLGLGISWSWRRRGASWARVCWRGAPGHVRRAREQSGARVSMIFVPKCNGKCDGDDYDDYGIALSMIIRHIKRTKDARYAFETGVCSAMESLLVFLDFLMARPKLAEACSACLSTRATRKSKNTKTAKTKNDFTVK